MRSVPVAALQERKGEKDWTQIEEIVDHQTVTEEGLRITVQEWVRAFTANLYKHYMKIGIPRQLLVATVDQKLARLFRQVLPSETTDIIRITLQNTPEYIPQFIQYVSAHAEELLTYGKAVVRTLEENDNQS